MPWQVKVILDTRKTLTSEILTDITQFTSGLSTVPHIEFKMENGKTATMPRGMIERAYFEIEEK